MTVKSIESVITSHASHLETVAPGQPYEFSSASVAGDCVAQGDLYLTLVDRVPDGYVRVANPPKQLVPESGAGSHHRLDALAGVEFWAPQGWRVDAVTDALDGPCLVLTRKRRIVHDPGHAHPHGTVTVPAGRIVLCTYQREWLREQQRIARVLD